MATQPAFLSTSAAARKNLSPAIAPAAAVLVTGGKFLAALATGSLGLLADAVRSALEAMASLTKLFAARSPARGSALEQTRGSRAMEGVAALVEPGLLLLTCVWIIPESLNRLLFRFSRVETSTWSALIVIASILAGIALSRAGTRADRHHHRAATEAPGRSRSIDTWLTAAVLLGFVLARVAVATGWAWLAQADSLAALGVAGSVIKASVRLGRRTGANLVAAVPQVMHEEILHTVTVEGVQEVRQVRVRHADPDLFVEAVLTAPRGTSFVQAQRMARDAEAAVRALHVPADVEDGIDPDSHRDGNRLDFDPVPAGVAVGG